MKETKMKKTLEWYQNELKKDKVELEAQKNKFIKEISGLSKDDILPKPNKKMTLWKRIIKVILG